MSMIQLTVQLATQNPQDVDPETLVFLVILTSGPKKLVISSHASSIFHLDEIKVTTELSNGDGQCSRCKEILHHAFIKQVSQIPQKFMGEEEQDSTCR
ncbi:hypothetical protein O9G_000034 [Rozella allomycis CSF55]|uniref:Uncharacterized protein n=1 Tax=Rozella allomycis (strain CSF55) TaxID=988480 RepID=A0A075ASQ3_ROZAC|nr:hypothetical protein O9G_000034 [Rozella allomycis CSF55]|eukprot:EPZ31558.1 hypothetical protein O9G_000034 [Rozella allomycis CSF55]